MTKPLSDGNRNRGLAGAALEVDRGHDTLWQIECGHCAVPAGVLVCWGTQQNMGNATSATYAGPLFEA